MLGIIAGMGISAPTAAQEAGELWVRPAVVLVAGVTFGVDAEYALTPHLSGVAVARKIDEGIDCLGPLRISPCRPDGTSYGVGIRLRTSPAGFGLFAEAIGGFHDYRRDGLYSMRSVGAGFRWGSGGWGNFEIGLESRWLGVALLDIDYERVDIGTRRSMNLRAGVGIRVGG